jgi:outer membrane protein OmpA-like peptidoglycan-associated protein
MTTHRTVRRIAVAIALALAATVVAACGGSHKNPHTGSPTTDTTPTTPTPTTATTTAAATPIATAAWNVQNGASDNGPVSRAQVLIYDLRRQGPFLVLDFGLRCMSSAGCSASLSTDPHQLDSQAAADHQGNNSSLSGVDVVDPTNAVEYEPAEDDQWSDTSVFPTGDTSSIDPSQIYMGWVRYRVPPASVSSLDVTFPGGGPAFSDIPVSNGPAPVLGSDMVRAQDPPLGPHFSTSSAAGLTLPVPRLTLTSGTDSAYTANSARRSSVALRGDVLFRFDKSNLTRGAHGVLSQVAADIKARATGTVTIIGYTDDIGTQAFNLGLSRRRADAVLTAIRKLTPGVHYVASGRGEADPVASNKYAAGRALNRRVTVSFAVKRMPRSTSPGDSATARTATGSLTFQSPTQTRYRLSLSSAKREGQLLLVGLKITCLTRSSCQVGGDLGAGADTIPPQPFWQAFYPPGTHYLFGDAPQFDTTSGFTLLDTPTGEIYLPARAGHVPLTSTFFGTDIPFRATFTGWAYYPAPSATTTRLQLLAPVSGPEFKVHAAGRPEISIPAS